MVPRSLNLINPILVVKFGLAAAFVATKFTKFIAPDFAFAILLFVFILPETSISKKILWNHVPPSHVS